MNTKYDSFFHTGELYLVHQYHFLHNANDKKEVRLKSGIMVMCVCNQHSKQHIAMLLTEDGHEVRWPELVDPEPYYKKIESCL